MIDEIDFETYLYISKNHFKIFVFDKKSLKNLYQEVLKVHEDFKFQELKELTKFLDDNIFKIENLVGNFIKNIILILENDKSSYVDICLKKKNYYQLINEKNLENILIEAKDLFNENYKDQMIMHMVISNFIINGKEYSSIRNNLKSDNLCLDINFKFISNELIFILDKILENYQIKVSQYLNGNYIKDFFREDDIELSEMVYKIRNGYNSNEVMLIPKSIINKGFFEKFFQFFS